MNGERVIPLGNGQILLRGVAVVDCWRAVSYMIKTSRTRDGLTPPSRLVQLERALSAEAVSAGGHDGRPQTPDPAPLEAEPISTEEAAEMLGLSTRQVRRIAASLGGRRVAGRWTFDPTLVTLYAEEKTA